MTPQIDHLGKMSTVLRVSTHIYGVSKDIGGKTFIFHLNLGMWPSNQLCWKNKSCSEVSTHIYGVSQEIDGKMFILRVNLGMWPLKSIISEKWAPHLKVSHNLNRFTLHTALHAIQLYVLSFGVELLDRSVIYLFLQQMSINLQLLLCFWLHIVIVV